MNENQVCILGSGTSTGIPMLGCNCQVCTSSDPKNKRLRTSILITTAKDKKILVDTGPDLRSQLLREHIQNIDAVIMTHDHADHLHGIDDLRPYTFKSKGSIPVYTHSHCAEIMKKRFPYIFDQKTLFGDQKILGGGLPSLHLEIVQNKKIIEGLEFSFYLLPHGHTKTLGFICEKLAYFIDCITIPEEAIEEMRQKKIEELIIDCVKREPHSTHLNLKRALYFAEKIGAKRTGLIHMGHELEHYTLEKELKDSVKFDVRVLYDQEKFYF